ncbi:SRPBCC family protein [Cellulomonas soli]|uniref:Activator of Hsp90 ATPase homologue 1/2-like C-terminal domain-containing protein n=1 Tax=Cellulomonas soli TaxID=931535 RepID=A0A512PIK5_9CELL|nr:SRPBCC domain-containing protein [Cellulomonas soli]NYI57477.1 uncharacterized protein YndB with AHSA1/START domain [Cellulomonas soli]GEP71041.1 hypothetical protein CSO01_37560 [Cellulomonas soli]
MTSHTTERDVGGDHLHLVHVLDATRPRVFRHLVEPDLVARWVGPHSARVPVEQVVLEPFPGGRWEFVAVDVATSTAYPVSARVAEIDPPRLLVCHELDADTDDPVQSALNLRIELFEDGDARTRIEVRQGPFLSGTTMAEDSAEVWVQSLEKLDALLEQTA